MFLFGILLCISVGAAIGLRFRVYVLAFAILAAAALAAAHGVTAGRHVLVILGEVIGVGVALQAGYLFGIFLRAQLRVAPKATTPEVEHAGALASGLSEVRPD